MDKYEKAAIDNDRSEIARLKAHCHLIDPSGAVLFAGKSVVDWAIHLMGLPSEPSCTFTYTEGGMTFYD